MSQSAEVLPDAPEAERLIQEDCCTVCEDEHRDLDFCRGYQCNNMLCPACKDPKNHGLCATCHSQPNNNDNMLKALSFLTPVSLSESEEGSSSPGSSSPGSSSLRSSSPGSFSPGSSSSDEESKESTTTPCDCYGESSLAFLHLKPPDGVPTHGLHAKCTSGLSP